MQLNSKAVTIRSDLDIAAARTTVRGIARTIGFNAVDQARIATAVSELARNILNYAGSGHIIIHEVEQGERKGIQIEAVDQGPGIADVNKALQEGYSTSGGTGMGLPGARRLMNEFNVQTAPGAGTTITCLKWLGG
jgi:serine/threonine-protein kinase RsbT